MDVASKDKSRVPLDALTFDQQYHKPNVRNPAHDITGKPASLKISWVGPQMATWRITGYVADSEDEDEEIDFSIQRHRTSGRRQRDDAEERERSVAGHTVTANDNGEDLTRFPGQTTPTLVDSSKDQEFDNISPPATINTEVHLNPDATVNESQSQHGPIVPTTHDEQILTRSVSSQTRNTFHVTFDDLDSPLSTPPDLPTLAPDRETSRVDNGPVTDFLPSSTYVTSRNFRPRKAIQINPYLLDFAKHQKEWGERGLKPVHIPRALSPQFRENQHESLESASRDDSQISVDALQESTDVAEASATKEIDFLDLDGGLPDLDAILKENAASRRRHAKSKRKSLNHAGQMAVEDNVFDLPSSDDDSRQGRKTGTQATVLHHDSFPSPPRSGSMSVRDELPSPYSEGSDSPKLLTPAASTGLQSRRWRHVIDDDSQSQHEPDQGLVIVSSSEASDDSSETESEAEDVRLMQKRLRGVIPASYLTVQKAHQAMMKIRKETAKASKQAVPGPGIAQRRVIQTSNRTNLEGTTSKWYEDLASDEEDSQKELVENVSSDLIASNEVMGMSNTHLQPYEDIEAAETMEDAGIDQMLPRRPRTQHVRRKQQRSPLHGTGMTGERKRRRSHQYDLGEYAIRPQKWLKRTLSKSTVHVLDAPGLSPRNVRRPPWLRIAARQARRTKTTGTIAAQKFFQFDSPEGTADALDGLVDRTHVPSRQRIEAVPRKTRPVSARRRNGPFPTDLSTFSKPRPRNIRWPLLSSPSGQGYSTGQQHDDADDSVLQNETEPGHVHRLISLLSRKNRAGQGRLIYRPTEPRSAQLEEIQQSYRGLSRVTRNAPAPPSLHREAPASGLIHPTPTTNVLDVATPLEDSPIQLDAPPAVPMRAPKRATKRTPVYRPRVRQTLLAPLKLNTEKLYALIGRTGSDVRTELEREFVAHQSEWFQGRKEGIVCANEATQQHFQVYLEVLRSYLLAASNGPDGTADVRGLRSFLFRLVPNRGSIGAQGQVGDKTMDVLSYDIVVAKNVFDLHVYMLNLAPACAPLPRVLETKVNFADAHNEICTIAMSAWQAICGHHHTQHFIIDGLSGWLYLILTQLITRWKSAESDARTDAEQSMQRIEERVIRKVIEHNRAQASKLVSVALNGLVQGIEDSISTTEAESLLNIDRYTGFILTISKFPDIDSDMYSATFKVASSYADQWLTQTPSSIMSLLSSLRLAISTITSHTTTFTSETQASMIHAFFSTARVAVNHRQKSWDDFFAPMSSYSLDIFVSDRHVDSSKAFFYYHLLEAEPDVYYLDFRKPILSHWLRVLLQLQDDVARIDLTRSVLNQEKVSLDLAALTAAFHVPGTTVPSTTVRDNISEIRYATILHVIAELSGQENNAEAEWLPGGLDDADGVHLLKTIFSTMKETWMSLDELPEQQDDYTLLVHAALNQYEVHSRSDFSIEAWFFNPAMIPQRRKRTLAKVLSQHSLSDDDFVQNAREFMHQELMYAKRTGKLEELKVELKNELFPLMIDTAMRFQHDERTGVLLRHILFIHDVLLPLMRQDETSGAMVLDVLCDIASFLECRIPIHNDTILVSILELFTGVIVALPHTLATMGADDRVKIYIVTLVTFELGTTVGSILPNDFVESVGYICGLAMLDDSIEGSALIEAVVSMG